MKAIGVLASVALLVVRLAPAGEFTAKSYVQTGLIAQWDGIENVGYGKAHDADAECPSELTGNVRATLSGTMPASDKYFALGSGYLAFSSDAIKAAVNEGSATVELRVEKNGAYCQNGGFVHFGDSTRGFWIWQQTAAFVNGHSYHAKPSGEHDTLGYDDNGANTLSFVLGLTSEDSYYSVNCSRRRGLTRFGTPMNDSTCHIGRLNSDTTLANAKMYSLRVYDRPLSEGEMLWNSIVDQVRFEGKSIDEVTLPDGYYIDKTDGHLKKTIAACAVDYRQEDLYAQWDGLENAARGVHDVMAGYPVDLKGNVRPSLTGTMPTGDDSFFFGRGHLTFSSEVLKDAVNDGNLTVELHLTKNGTYHHNGGFFSFGEKSRGYWVYQQNGAFVNGHSYHAALSGQFRSLDYDESGVNTLSFVAGPTTEESWFGENGVAKIKKLTRYGTPMEDSACFMGCIALSSLVEAVAKLYSFRIYLRPLSDVETGWNSLVDQIRFEGKTQETAVLPNGWHFSPDYNLMDAEGTVLLENPNPSYVWTGLAGTADWSDVGNWAYAGGGAALCAPVKGTVTIGTAHVTVGADVVLDQLNVSKGGCITVTEGVSLATEQAAYGNEPVARAVLSGNAAQGWPVEWVQGAGSVRIAGSKGAPIPEAILQPTEDGWYEVGLKNGYGHGNAQSALIGGEGSWNYVDAEHLDWDRYAIPQGSKLRLVGGVLLDTVPNCFSEIDQTQMKLIYLNSSTAFADGTPLKVPAEATCCYQPGTWLEDVDGIRHWLRYSEDRVMAGDLVVDGCLQVSGDDVHLVRPTFDGCISGQGRIHVFGFSNQGRFRGAFDFNGLVFCEQNANVVWIDADVVTGHLTDVWLGDCAGSFATNPNYCATGILFGKDGSGERADGELVVDLLEGKAAVATDESTGKRWRQGGQLVVWGDNTVHVGKLTKGLHVMASRADQDCVNGFFNASYVSVGNGNLVVDDFASGTIYASTNVSVKVGSVAADTAFDYTLQSGAVNMMTLDVTNACAASARVKATDLAMLPSRLSGFTGAVELTGTEAKAYPVTIDLAKGPNAVYNYGGCAGSGVLASAPSAGTVTVSLKGEDAAVLGTYGIARFSSGGERLSNWTVSIDGHQGTSFSLGSGENLRNVRLHQDDRGIWLRVSKPAFAIILR